jgi:amidase
MSDGQPPADATEQAELVRTGAVSPLELVDAAIERTTRLNPRLNAVIHERFEQARAEARASIPDGPFRGVPILLKDLDGFAAGEPFHAGTKHLRDLAFRAPHDSHLTTRFRQAGMIVIGRTNTPELGLIPTTEPEAYGPTRNPWNTEHSAAGSSGGAAAAVAAGMVAVAHAGDGGGSIRIPASACGLVGLKPSRGRVSVGPEAGEAWGGLVARLVVSRTVRDTAAVLDCAQGPMTGDPYTAAPPLRPYAVEVGADPGRLRIGFTTHAADPDVTTDPQCVEAVHRTAGLLEAEGHHLTESRPACWDDADLQASLRTSFISAYAAWTAAELDHLGALAGVPFGPDGVEPGTWAIAEMGRALTAPAYVGAMADLHAYVRRQSAWWDDYDVLLTPTIPELPPLIGEVTSTPDDPLRALVRSASIVAFCLPFNMSGQPALSVPAAMGRGGLPIGVQLVGPHGRDDLLLRLAAQLERAAPWAHRRPAVHA